MEVFFCSSSKLALKAGLHFLNAYHVASTFFELSLILLMIGMWYLRNGKQIILRILGWIKGIMSSHGNKSDVSQDWS